MADHIDQVLGPADDTVTFFQARGMFFVTVLWVVAAVWVVCLGLYVLGSFLLGARPGAGDIVIYAEIALVVPVVVASAVLLAV